VALRSVKPEELIELVDVPDASAIASVSTGTFAVTTVPLPVEPEVDPLGVPGFPPPPPQAVRDKTTAKPAVYFNKLILISL
jgi:hypothetical protein